MSGLGAVNGLCQYWPGHGSWPLSIDIPPDSLLAIENERIENRSPAWAVAWDAQCWPRARVLLASSLYSLMTADTRNMCGESESMQSSVMIEIDSPWLYGDDIIIYARVMNNNVGKIRGILKELRMLIRERACMLK